MKGTLTADQQKTLQELQASAERYRALGPTANRLALLNLTDEQKTKIQAIVDKHGPELQRLRLEQRTAQDKQAVMTQIREATQKATDEVKTVLTPEQQRQLAPRRRNQTSP